MDDNLQKPSQDTVTVSTPCGTGYYTISSQEAKKLYQDGQISSSQYVWSVSNNQWIAVKDFFQSIKQTSKLSMEKIGQTAILSMDNIRRAAQRHSLSTKLAGKNSQTGQVVTPTAEPLNDKNKAKELVGEMYNKIVKWLT